MDTNVFCELAKTKPNEQVIKWLRNHESELYLSTISIGEIRRGIEVLPAGKRKKALQAWFSALCKRMEGRILSFNTSTAHVWGQLMAAWDKKGTTVPSLDSQLAATAHRHKLTMVTRNVADFKNTGVKVINPFAS
ncbi:MAG: type II toxin-antitoxin system VapC family toxin [Akkermansiaceae bacterium]